MESPQGCERSWSMARNPARRPHVSPRVGERASTAIFTLKDLDVKAAVRRQE